MAEAIPAEVPAEDPEEIEREAGRTTNIVDIKEGAPWNEVEEAFLRRRSVRKYKKRQVPAHLIRRIIEVARFAPTQGNCQPWKFIVLRERDMIDGIEQTIKADCKEFSEKLNYTNYEKGTWKRFVTEKKANFFNRLDPHMMHPVPMQVTKQIADGNFMVLHNAPTVVLILMDKRGIGIPELDIGICGTNLITAAQSHGLGTCWVGLIKFLTKHEDWMQRLGVEEPWELVEAITIGYPIGNPSQNMIPRETHEIQWFENGTREIVY